MENEEVDSMGLKIVKQMMFVFESHAHGKEFSIHDAFTLMFGVCSSLTRNILVVHGGNHPYSADIDKYIEIVRSVFNETADRIRDDLKELRKKETH